MRKGTKYDETCIVEDVVLPMANLMYSLEAILNQEQEISTDDLLRGLRSVHKNARAILWKFSPEEATSLPELPARKTSMVLRAFATERDAFDDQMESAI